MPANPVHLAEEVFRLAGEFNAAVQNAHDAGIRVEINSLPYTPLVQGGQVTSAASSAPSVTVDLVLTTQTAHPHTPAEPTPKPVPVPEETWAIGSNETSVRWPVIPVRTEEGRRIRSALASDQEASLLSVDYSQIERRFIAHYLATNSKGAAWRYTASRASHASR